MHVKKCFKNINTTTVLVVTRKFHGTILGAINPSNVDKYNINAIFVWYPVKFSKIDLILMPFYKLFRVDVERLIENRKKKINSKIDLIFKKYKPLGVFVVQGIQLYPYLIDKFKQSSYVACQMADRISLFPELKEYIKHYEMIYTYSSEDAETIKAFGVEGKYVPPQGQDIYKPLSTKKTIDVSFVGVMYEDRLELLKKLVFDLPNVNFVFYGKYCSRFDFKKNLEWLFNKRIHKCFKNREITEKKSCVLYNKSKICLNLNRENAGNSWAGRFASILRTKSFQIMTYNDLANDSFHNCLVLFNSVEELENQIVTYLEDDSKRISITDQCFNTYFDKENGFVFDVAADFVGKIQNKLNNGK